MNYGTAISLAAASRALKDYNPELSKEALRVARFIWDDEHNHQANPEEQTYSGRFSNPEFMKSIECRAAFELWRSTDYEGYKTRMNERSPPFWNNSTGMPCHCTNDSFHGYAFKKQVRPLVEAYAGDLPK